jgi:hypothetical protein
MTIQTTDASHEDVYLVTVRSKLFNESAFSPSFEFEIYLYPSPCVHAVLNPNGTIKVLDLDYQIHPANIEATTEFNAFTANPNDCIIQYRFSFDTANPTALSLLTKEAAAINLGIASSMVLT